MVVNESCIRFSSYIYDFLFLCNKLKLESFFTDAETFTMLDQNLHSNMEGFCRASHI